MVLKDSFKPANGNDEDLTGLLAEAEYVCRDIIDICYAGIVSDNQVVEDLKEEITLKLGIQF